MFTGIVNGLGKVVKIIPNCSFYTYMIKVPKNILYNLSIGSSVSNNGCCLTITKILNNFIYFDVIVSTLNCTNFKFIKVDDFINLERSLRLGEEIGGHLISGHIMSTAVTYKINNFSKVKEVWFRICKKKITKYLFVKGFICVNGVSLTISEIKKDKFSVNLIPQTLNETNLFFLNIGDYVNIEIDIYTKIIIDQIFLNTCC